MGIPQHDAAFCVYVREEAASLVEHTRIGFSAGIRLFHRRAGEDQIHAGAGLQHLLHHPGVDPGQIGICHQTFSHPSLVGYQHYPAEAGTPLFQLFQNAGHPFPLAPVPDIIPFQMAVQNAVAIQEKGIGRGLDNRLRSLLDGIPGRNSPLRLLIIFGNAYIYEVSVTHPASQLSQGCSGFQNFLFEGELLRQTAQIQPAAVYRINSPIDEALLTKPLLLKGRYDISLQGNGTVAVEIFHRLQGQGYGILKRHGFQLYRKEGVSVNHKHLIFTAFFQCQTNAAPGSQRRFFYCKIVLEGPRIAF